MITTAGSRRGQRQEFDISSGSPTWVAEAQVLGSSSSAFQAVFAGSCIESRGPGTRIGYLECPQHSAALYPISLWSSHDLIVGLHPSNLNTTSPATPGCLLSLTESTFSHAGSFHGEGPSSDLFHLTSAHFSRLTASIALFITANSSLGQSSSDSWEYIHSNKSIALGWPD